MKRALLVLALLLAQPALAQLWPNPGPGHASYGPPVGWTAIGPFVSHAVSSSTITYAPTTTAPLEAGNVGVCIISKDETGTGTTDGSGNAQFSSASDPVNGNWDEAIEYCEMSTNSPNTGQCVAIYYKLATTTLASGSAITFLFPAATTGTKAITCYEFSIPAGHVVTLAPIGANGIQFNGDLPSLTDATNVAREHLFIRGSGCETGVTGYGLTPTYTTFNHASSQIGSGTSGSAARGEFKIQNVATSTASDPTYAGGESANVIIALDEIVAVGSTAQTIGGMVTAAQITRAQTEIALGTEPWASAWPVIVSRCDPTGLAEAPSAVPNYVVPTIDPGEASKLILRNDVNAAFACALAGTIGHGLSPGTRDTYRQKAQDLINNWATVNISVAGSGTEVEEGQLIFSYVASAFATTAELLSLDPTWDSTERAAYTAWVDLVHDQVYNDIQDRTNNWGSWASLLGIAASRWKGNDAELATRITRLKAQIDSQINSASQTPVGGLPLELGRNNGDGPVSYSAFSMSPMAHAAWMVRNTTSEDLFSYTPPSGGTINQALTFFYALVNDVHLADASCGCDASTFDPPTPTGWAGQLLFAGGQLYGTSTWLGYATHPLGTSNGAWKAVDLLEPVPPAPTGGDFCSGHASDLFCKDFEPTATCTTNGATATTGLPDCQYTTAALDESVSYRSTDNGTADSAMFVSAFSTASDVRCIFSFLPEATDTTGAFHIIFSLFNGATRWAFVGFQTSDETFQAFVGTDQSAPAVSAVSAAITLGTEYEVCLEYDTDTRKAQVSVDANNVYTCAGSIARGAYSDPFATEPATLTAVELRADGYFFGDEGITSRMDNIFCTAVTLP